MVEILEFIFRDFWTFCGVIILLYTIGAYCIAAPISAIAEIFNKETTSKKKNSNTDYEKIKIRL